MAIVQGRQTYAFRDAKGQTARMAVYITYDNAEAAPDAYSVAHNLSGAITAATNAALIGATGPFSLALPSAYGDRADYVDAEDKAIIVVQSSGGTLHRFAIPAPKAAVFMADGQTVSPSSGLVTAFVTALATPTGSAYVSDRTGVGYGSGSAGFVGGYRTRRRMSRRLTIWTLSGGLDEPAE